LRFHPHIHCIVPGGGLSPDKTAWIRSLKNYFLPVRVLSSLFRGKFLSGLEKASRSTILHFPHSLSRLNDSTNFTSLLKTSCATDWVVYAKKPFASPERVLRYLGNYTHRVAISNSRILSVTDSPVNFQWKDRRHECQLKSMTLDPLTFIKRFLLHILPTGFVRIRAYGILANPCKKGHLQLIQEIPRLKAG